MTCDEYREALGALVLGLLDDAEAQDVRAHLEGCAACRAEHDELRRLPRLLGMVPLDQVEHPPLPELDAEALVARVAADRRRAHRRRLVRATAAGLGVAAVAATAGFLLAGSGATAEEPADLTLRATDEATGVWAEVALDDVGWGTRISLELAGVEAGSECSLVAASRTGTTTASHWRVPADVDDYLTIPGAVGLALADIDAFLVVDEAGSTLVEIPHDASAVVAPGSHLDDAGLPAHP